ncbi:MAG: hypothetical protein HYZ54_08340 [Ignavibacteriae bacterium]|nr:hypothetical protein [Ignavibacteriota bacterium]
MYRGFNLDLLELNYLDASLFERGQILFNDNKSKVKKTMENYIGVNGSLLGSKMQEDWFPQIKADIFISHSHKDEKKAIVLAGWLERNLGMKAFIDSCIWENSNDLLSLINNRYCLNPDGKTFNYDKLNYSASHIHMMLSTALTMMIDKTECLFFLNTPNSISASGVINRTESPWIYSEISTAKLIRKKMPDRISNKGTKDFSEKGGLGENLRVQYELNLNYLTKLNLDSLNIWNNKATNDVHSLDTLYKLHPLPMPPTIKPITLTFPK